MNAYKLCQDRAFDTTTTLRMLVSTRARRTTRNLSVIATALLFALATYATAAADTTPGTTAVGTTPVGTTPAGMTAVGMTAVGTAPVGTTTLGTIPKGTRLRFHVTAPISSDESRTGEPFAFVLLEPIVSDGKVIVAQGATGEGTVFLAGHAGSSGHEGDLTLRIDSAQTVDGNVLKFDEQRFEVNGRNRKVAVQVLGFVPYAGLMSGLIRGSDVRVSIDRPIETVLLRPATITEIAPVDVPAPAAATGSMLAP